MGDSERWIGEREQLDEIRRAEDREERRGEKRTMTNMPPAGPSSQRMTAAHEQKEHLMRTSHGNRRPPKAQQAQHAAGLRAEAQHRSVAPDGHGAASAQASHPCLTMRRLTLLVARQGPIPPAPSARPCGGLPDTRPKTRLLPPLIPSPRPRGSCQGRPQGDAAAAPPTADVSMPASCSAVRAANRRAAARSSGPPPQSQPQGGGRVRQPHRGK